MPLHRRLYAYALSILNDESDAADCIQEAFTKLWEQRARIAKLDNVEGYAVITVKNLALNMATRKPKTLPDQASRVNPPPDTAESAPDPADALEAREHLKAMAGMLKTLPENQRKVVLLSAVNGLSNSEIGEVTGLSDDNVRVLLSRGRKKLRTLFSNWLQKDI